MQTADNERSLDLQSDASSGLLRSFLLGPMRALVPALLNVLLMSVIVSKGGLQTVGLWGIFNLLVGIFLLGDFGVSQHISRDLSAGLRSMPEVRATVEAIIGFWLLATVLIIALALVFARPILASQGIEVNAVSFGALALLPLTCAAALICGLYTFMHISAHQVHYAQVNQVVGAFMQFAVAICLLHLVEPYLALVIALASGYAVRAVGLYRNLRRINFEAAPRRLRWPSTRFLIGLFRQTKGFALLGAAQQLFHIVNRIGILTFGGTAVLGAFEIASRVPFLLEQAFGNGLQPLFAVFAGADWHSDEGKAKIRRLAQWIYDLLVVTSIGCLAAWIALSGSIIGIWLNLDNPDLVFATQLFGLFNAVRTFNVPTFWVLQARHSETWIGAVYMAQVVTFLLILAVLSMFMVLTFPVIAIVITVLSIVAELSAAAVAEFRIGYLRVVVRSWRDLAPFAATFVLLIGAWLLAAPPARRAEAMTSGLVPGLIYGSLWLCILLALSGGRPRKLLRHPA